MNATTTQLLSSGELCKLRYDTIPVKSVSANVSFYTNNSKMPIFLVVTLLLQTSDMQTDDAGNVFLRNVGNSSNNKRGYNAKNPTPVFSPINR